MWDAMHQTTAAQQLAQNLRNRQPLDMNTPEPVRREALAIALAKAGAAIAPNTKSPRKVIKALTLLEELAGVDSSCLSLAWLGIRSLDLRPGESVGGRLVDDPLNVATPR